MGNPVLVEVRRGGALESRHAGALAVVDAGGRVVAALGDIERPVFPRSAVKLLQALPLVESGAADRLALTDDELALACASHGGEPAHVQGVASMLSKAGLDADALECGAHWPAALPAARALAAAGKQPGALHNNCSGKHAGFLCLACLLAASGDAPHAFARGYVRAGHPVMREVGAVLAATTGCDLDALPSGIDGCSIPAHAFPLRALALAFARIATGSGLSQTRASAALRLRKAIAAAPHMVAGSDRFDTIVMQRLGLRACVKVGAEGVHCAALPERGLGVAIKIDDGAGRAAEVVMASVLLAFVSLDDGDRDLLGSLAGPTLSNWRGVEVGSLAPSEALGAALARAT